VGFVTIQTPVSETEVTFKFTKSTKEIKNCIFVLMMIMLKYIAITII